MFEKSNDIKSNILRMATLNDIEEVFGLVQELAAYENSSHMIKVDVPYYKSEFEKNSFNAIVAEIDGQIVGTCIYYMTFSTWKGRCVYLEDFIVKQEYRGRGIGQLLYNRFLDESKKMDARMVMWQVLDWNEPAIRFYKKNNAVIDKEWWNCKVYF